MEELRWILLVVGLLILGGIYFFADPANIRRKAEASDDPVPESSPPGPLDEDIPDSDMERELRQLGQLISEERQAGTVDGLREQPGEPVLSEEPEKVVVLFLRVAGNRRLVGSTIAEAADKVGLTFGDRQIFHRLQDVGERSEAIFSMADMVRPGSFDPNAMDTATTAGLCLFLTLPNPLSALDAWDAMLATGQRLADILEVDLLDESQSSLSRQRVAHVREEMREFDRRYEYQLPR